MAVLSGVNVTDVTTDGIPKFTVGSIFQDDDGKQFKYLLFNNGAGDVASIAGDFGYYYAVSGAGAAANSNTCTMDRTDSGGIGAGVFQSVISNGQYGWLQVTGEATLTQALTAGADGNALTAVGAGADGAVDVSAAVTDAVCAFAYDASAKIVKLCCPL
tara:strand:- start:141 stop:617 length:477 start_codon:yes stop_codon:yes gene_type:complete